MIINNANKSRNFLIVFVIGFLILINLSVVCAGGIMAEDLKKLTEVRAEIEKGNLDNLLTTLDKTDSTHISILFGGMENSNLIKVWDKMEIKNVKGEIDKVKTDKYRNMLLLGMDSSLEKGKAAVDSFIGDLIKRNSNSNEFKFVGSKDSKGMVVDGDFINLKDASGNVHKVPLKDLTGFKKMVFSEMKGGGNGYAVHYIPEKGTDSAAVLSSGYLKGDKTKGYEVMDMVGNELKSVGHVNFGDNPQGAIYFRGIPKDVDVEKFSKGDYIFHKPGRTGDISFKDGLGLLESSERDIANGDGARVGYQSESGIRGIKKLDTNGDDKPDKIIDIVHQNGVGIKYGDKVIGAGSDKKIEIKDNGNDIEIIFPKEIINAQVINNNGKILSKDENSKEFSVGKGEPIKFINGKINGILVDRQDSDAGSKSGRVIGPGPTDKGFEFSFEKGQIAPPKKDPSQELLGGRLEDFSRKLNPQKEKNPIKEGMDPFSSATYDAVNSVRQGAGRAPLPADAEMSRKAYEYSKLMASRGNLVHSRMGYGENIAYFSGSKDMSSEEVGRRFSTLWAKSSGHYRNIVNSGYSKTGMGVYFDGNLWWGTQMFK